MSTNLASYIYKTATPYSAGGESKLDAIPRQKMHYVVTAEVSSDAAIDANDDVWLLTDAVSLPGYRYNTQTLNQYNRKRVVQTRIDYDPIQMSVVDTVDNSFLKLLISYNQHYFGNMNTGGQARGALLKTPEEYVLDTTVDSPFNFGYHPTQHTQKYFFDTITIHRQYGGEDQRVIIINPLISQVQHDQLTYAAGADAVRWNLTLEYEGIRYEGFESKISFNSVVQQANADDTVTEDPLLAFGGPGPTIQTPSANQPVINSVTRERTSIVRDRNGNPVRDGNGNPVTSTGLGL
jgi:hypothetical protein